jgi:N-acetylglutamate synthase-like GNAT family acetyltransferase
LTARAVLAAAAGARTAVTAGSLRPATAGDAGGIHALVIRYQREGRLLPRPEAEIARHAERFLVVEDLATGAVVACAELAPLSGSVAEVRSLVVHEEARGLGFGRVLVETLAAEASMAGFRSLCAFTHEPGYFVRLGFSLVPHAWLPEKIAVDCAGCALFRQCGQDAVRLDLAPRERRR